MTISASMLSDAMISANVLIEKLLGLGRKPEEVYPQTKQDGEVHYVDMGRLDFELHLPPSDPGWVTGTADVWPVRSYSLHAPKPDRCPYCGSKSTNDERGNCAACGGPR